MSKETERFEESVREVREGMINRIANNVMKACLLVEKDAKKLCPVDKGQLRASMFSDVVLNNGEIKGYVGNSDEIAPYVHQGTGIYAVNGDGRKTPWVYKSTSIKVTKSRGIRVKSNWVTTRGQKPQLFLKRAVQMNVTKIEKLLGS